MTGPNENRPMRSRREPLAGGAPLALAIIAGVIVGGLWGEPIIGLIVGVAIGIAIAVAIWLTGRD